MRKASVFTIVTAILLILQVIAIYMINQYYYLIIHTSFYSSLLAIQLFLLAKISWESKRKELIFNTFLVLIMPILILTSLPNYSYDEGEWLIREEHSIEYVTFNTLEKKVVPVGQDNRFKSWLVKDYYYYYAALDYTGEPMFFVVNPYDGQIFTQLEDFWSFESK